MTEPETNRLIDRILESIDNQSEAPDYDELLRQEQALEAELYAMDEAIDTLEDAEEVTDDTMECTFCNCMVSVDNICVSPSGDDICRWCLGELYGTEVFE